MDLRARNEESLNQTVEIKVGFFRTLFIVYRLGLWPKLRNGEISIQETKILIAKEALRRHQKKVR